MKLLLKVNFFIFITCALNAQVEHVKVEKIKSNPLVPSIAGYSDGVISYVKLCDSFGILSSGDFIVKSFKLNYRGEEVIIKGNRIPDSVCVYIGQCSSSQMIFLTDIMAENTKKEAIILYPLNLEVIKNEE